MQKITYTVHSVIAIKNLVSVKFTSYLARVLSRILIVRIDDFINLTRRYNNANTTNSILKKKIKNQLFALSELYEEYLREQRHKFSAHFQDKNLHERIELWGEINENKISFFCQQIIDIYKLFESNSEYVPINDSTLLLSNEKKEKIERLSKEEDNLEKVKSSADVLSMTRPNMTSSIVFHPVPEKMKVLNTISMFYDFLRKLYDILKDNPLYEKILKAQMITDLVSFKDNLIHKSGSQDIGLRYLIEQDIAPYKKILSYEKNKPSCYSPFSKWLPRKYIPSTVYKDGLKVIYSFTSKINDDIFNTSINIRNKIGAHIDHTLSFNNLVNLLNSLTICEIDELRKLLINLWLEVGNCHISLSIQTHKPLELKGVLGLVNNHRESFYENKIEKIIIPTPKTFSSTKEAFDLILKTWGKDEDAINFFNQGFIKSKMNVSIELENHYKYTFTDSGILLMKKLTSSCDLKVKRFLLNYISVHGQTIGAQCNGILLFSIGVNKESLLSEHIYLLGETGDIECDEIFEQLKFFAVQENITAIDSFIALLKIDLRYRGLHYANNRQIEPIETKFAIELKKLLQDLTKSMGIIVSTLMQSEIYFGKYTYANRYSDAIYVNFLNELVYENFTKINNPPPEEVLTNIKYSHENKVFTFTLNTLEQYLKNEDLTEFIHSLIINGNLVLNYKETVFMEHLAYSYFALDKTEKSIEVYEELIRRESSNVNFYIKKLEYICEMKNLELFDIELRKMYKYFNLKESEKEKINSIREELIENYTPGVGNPLLI